MAQEEWHKHLKPMRLVKHIPAIPWNYAVWFAQPWTRMAVHSLAQSAKALMMLLSGKIASHRSRVFIDSGATHKFHLICPCAISRTDRDSRYIQRYSGLVLCGGDASVPITGYVDAQTSLQQFSNTIRFYVLNLPAQSAFDAVLGQTWVKGFEALIDYANEHAGHFRMQLTRICVEMLLNFVLSFSNAHFSSDAARS